MQQLSAEEQEHIRRAYHLEHKSIRRIAKEFRHSRTTVSKVLAEDTKKPQQATNNRQTPVFGPHQSRVEDLLRLNEHMPRKQHYTSHKIFEIIQSEGYLGCESRVRKFISTWNRTHNTTDLYIPLEFEAGKDAQCDWGEAIAIIGGVRQTVQYFIMRLNFSRKTFVMAFPTQKQESFFYVTHRHSNISAVSLGASAMIIWQQRSSWQLKGVGSNEGSWPCVLTIYSRAIFALLLPVGKKVK